MVDLWNLEDNHGISIKPIS
uniref:Uncharacterized protein n=1 Tax=Anguilla anguilla TaxID=7936 RepID=A0A0E9V107_ANGAN